MRVKCSIKLFDRANGLEFINAKVPLMQANQNENEKASWISSFLFGCLVEGLFEYALCPIWSREDSSSPFIDGDRGLMESNSWEV